MKTTKISVPTTQSEKRVFDVKPIDISYMILLKLSCEYWQNKLKKR